MRTPPGFRRFTPTPPGLQRNPQGKPTTPPPPNSGPRGKSPTNPSCEFGQTPRSNQFSRPQTPPTTPTSRTSTPGWKTSPQSRRHASSYFLDNIEFDKLTTNEKRLLCKMYNNFMMYPGIFEKNIKD